MVTLDSSGEYDALFKQYVDVCNRALSSHAAEFPYKQIWGAFRHVAGKEGVRVAVYDDQPKTEYALRFEEDHIEADRSGDEESPVVRLNLSYLKQVVEHPEEYIENPARLDWDWLKNRMGKG